jgi:hypothetical protein
MGVSVMRTVRLHRVIVNGKYCGGKQGAEHHGSHDQGDDPAAKGLEIHSVNPPEMLI